MFFVGQSLTALLTSALGNFAFRSCLGLPLRGHSLRAITDIPLHLIGMLLDVLAHFLSILGLSTCCSAQGFMALGLGYIGFEAQGL